VRGSEVHAPLSPQQRQATQAAAPTLRLKLRPGSDAQASAPGSEEEDASRVRPGPTALPLSPRHTGSRTPLVVACLCAAVPSRTLPASGSNACFCLCGHPRGPAGPSSQLFNPPTSAGLPEPACFGTSAPLTACGVVRSSVHTAQVLPLVCCCSPPVGRARHRAPTARRRSRRGRRRPRSAAAPPPPPPPWPTVTRRPRRTRAHSQ